MQTKGCEDVVSTLRSGSAAEKAVAIMQEKGFMSQRKSRHRLTPGTVKFAAYHVLALVGDKGLNVLDIAERIQVTVLLMHIVAVSYVNWFNMSEDFSC